MEPIVGANDNQGAVNTLLESKKALGKMTFEDQLKEKDLVIESLKAEIAKKDKTIAEYQDVNQKLFLKVSAPISEEKPEEEPEDPVKKAALDKIEAHNKKLEEQENGSDNQQGGSSFM